MTGFAATFILVLFASIGNLRSQYLTPNSFDMGNATLGVPKYFNAVFHNTQSFPVRMTGIACTGYADMDFAWLHKSDSTRFDSTLIPAGEKVDIVVRIVPTSQGLLMSNCGIGLMEASGNVVGTQSFSMSGMVVGVPNVSAKVTDIQFDITAPGATSIRKVVLTNTGTGEAHLYSPSLNTEPFRIDSSGPWVIAAGDSMSLPLTYAPTEAGDSYKAIQFGHVYMPGAPVVRVQLHGATEAELTPAVPSVHIDDVQIGQGATVDVKLMTSSNTSVAVVSSTLRIGEVFTVLSPSSPVSLTPSSEFVVTVRCLPTAVGIFVDTLIVTTSKGSVYRIPINATAVVTSVSEFTSATLPHPNPSNSVIQWCGKPLEQWRIVNSIGEEVERVVADEDGNCRTTLDLPGLFVLVSERTGMTMQLMVIK